MQPPGLGNADAVEGDVGVLHHPQRGLAVDLLQGHAGGLTVHEEGLDLPVGRVAGEHGQDVGRGGAADPALGAVQDPGVAVRTGSPCGRWSTGRRRCPSRIRFGQRENALEREVDDLGHPLGLLFRGGADPDGGPEQPGLGGVEGGQRGVRPGEFEDPEPLVDSPGGSVRHRGAGQFGRLHEVQIDQRPGQLVRELAAFPVVGQQRLGLRVEEVPQPAQHRARRR